MTDRLMPGTVFAVRGGGLAGYLIGLGAALTNRPNMQQHVAIFHHYGDDGVPYGMEGRPGGFGTVDMRKYLHSPWSVNDLEYVQTWPAEACKRAQAEMLKMRGTRYDWPAIFHDTVVDLHLQEWLVRDWGKDVRPDHLVCSSAAAYLRERLGLKHPDIGHERGCQPAEWTEWIVTKAWR